MIDIVHNKKYIKKTISKKNCILYNNTERKKGFN